MTNNWGGRRPTLRGGVGGRQPPHVNGGVWGGAGAPPQNYLYKNHLCLFWICGQQERQNEHGLAWQRPGLGKVLAGSARATQLWKIIENSFKIMYFR